MTNINQNNNSSSSRSNWGIWSYLSLGILMIGLLSWVLFFTVDRLNYGFDKGTPIWTLTLIFNPVGVIFGIIGLVRKNRFSLGLTILNLLMTVSFFFMIEIIGRLFGP